jgi:hypothetical protein
MNIIHSILDSEVFRKQPPVLIDIGASAGINAKWAPIARYSICLAFDADSREFCMSDEGSSGYARLVTINRIVVPRPVEEADFYLTESPFCSSALEPATDKLQDWLFSAHFKVEKIIKLPTITIAAALDRAGIDYIDWFKTDSQGTDLRLFTSLPESIAQNVIAAEFEPGMMDAYKGEDKLHMVMEEMDRRGFWLSSMLPQGIQRISSKSAGRIGKLAIHGIRKSPFWAEVCYLREPRDQSERQLLLLCAFALIEKQWGFAMDVATQAQKRFTNPLFRHLALNIGKTLATRRLMLPLVYFKRKLTRLLAHIDG